MPESIGSPEMNPISTGLGEIYQYELKSADGSYDATALRTIQDWNVRRQLLGVPGVTEINSFGGYEKQYRVRVMPEKLQSYGLTWRDVYEAVSRNNGNVGGAYIEKGAEQYLLRGIGLVEKADDVANIVVKTGAEGVPVYVKDVGEVVEGATVRQGAVTADGKGEIVAGKEAGQVLEGEQRFNLVVRLNEDSGRNIETIKNLLLTAPNGSRVPLSQVADIKLVEGAAHERKCYLNDRKSEIALLFINHEQKK
ncbi:MAG: efflux RND transporter permease subunit [Pyrinomonadaceae bacterium]|nr:efflux RND transporter permease subunit [Pyrinomonadaceae bacterium]